MIIATRHGGLVLPRSYDPAVERFVQRAVLPRLTSHGLRHTAAAHMLQQSNDLGELRAIADILVHSPEMLRTPTPTHFPTASSLSWSGSGDAAREADSECQTAGVDLYGRAEILRELSELAEPLVLLHGDSGTGKSSLLAQAQQEAADSLAPPPVQVHSAPGSLQLALLESLGSILSELASDESLTERVGRLMVDAAERVKDARLKDLRSALGRHLLAIVRTRVSDEAADLIGEFSDAISSSQSESLRARITAASDSDVVEQIVDFASEVHVLADGRRVVLALDDVQRLVQACVSYPRVV